MPFDFESGKLEDVRIIRTKQFTDDRGHLAETYLKPAFKNAGITTEFIQDKHSKSKRNVLRGLHYQTGKHAQAKLVRCVFGVVLDVIVDLRQESPTFGEYSKHILSETDNKMIYQPRGFAHGYLVLSDTALFQYKLDNNYAPDNESGIIWNDSTLNIQWPINDPVLSDKDRELPEFEEIIENDLVF